MSTGFPAALTPFPVLSAAADGQGSAGTGGHHLGTRDFTLDIFKSRSLSLLDVGVRRFLRFMRIGAFHRGDHHVMLVVIIMMFVRHAKGRIVEKGERVAQCIEGLGQIVIVRRLIDRLMKLAIESSMSDCVVGSGR